MLTFTKKTPQGEDKEKFKFECNDFKAKLSCSYKGGNLYHIRFLINHEPNYLREITDYLASKNILTRRERESIYHSDKGISIYQNNKEIECIWGENYVEYNFIGDLNEDEDENEDLDLDDIQQILLNFLKNLEKEQLLKKQQFGKSRL